MLTWVAVVSRPIMAIFNRFGFQDDKLLDLKIKATPGEVWQLKLFVSMRVQTPVGNFDIHTILIVPIIIRPTLRVVYPNYTRAACHLNPLDVANTLEIS